MRYKPYHYPHQQSFKSFIYLSKRKSWCFMRMAWVMIKPKYLDLTFDIYNFCHSPVSRLLHYWRMIYRRYLHANNNQMFAFVLLFSTVRFQMSTQMACLRWCILTLVAFVWLFRIASHCDLCVTFCWIMLSKILIHH